MPLKSLLNHGAKHNPCLIQSHEMVPFLERPDVESGGEEETDGIGDELPIHIWIATKEHCFSTFFNSVEKDFRGVRCQVWAAEIRIDCFEDSRSRLSIDDVYPGRPLFYLRVSTFF
jgi:hypothetical protein